MSSTVELSFVSTRNGSLLRVEPDMPPTDALELAGELADGIGQLCERIHDGINNCDNAYRAEIRAIGFLGEVTGALIQSVSRGMEGEK